MADEFPNFGENNQNAVSQDDKINEEVVPYYFFRGFTYEEIRNFLQINHGLEISITTLKRQIKAYGLKRRMPDYDVGQIRAAIENIFDGYGSIHVPRIVVQEILREIDPEGTQLRKARRLKRRVYHNPRPNYAWHCMATIN